MFLFLPSPHKHPSFSSLLTIQSASSHTIPTPKNSRQNRTINTYNATIIPIFLPRRISVPQMQLLFFICRSHILKLLYRNSAAQQLFFLLCRCFICSSNYKSLIVSVIAMFLIRFVGSWTAIMHEKTTSKSTIPMVVNGIFQKPPKWLMTIFT